MKVAIAVSRFNHDITNELLEGTIQRLLKKGVAQDDIEIAQVPGAVELPLIAQRLAMMQRFDAIICLGAVIQGETDHYTYVCQQVSYGCQKVALEQNIPVIFGVLTTQTQEQARARVDPQGRHMGYESADAAVEMIRLLAGVDY